MSSFGAFALGKPKKPRKSKATTSIAPDAAKTEPDDAVDGTPAPPESQGTAGADPAPASAPGPHESQSVPDLRNSEPAPVEGGSESPRRSRRSSASRVKTEPEDDHSPDTLPSDGSEDEAREKPRTKRRRRRVEDGGHGASEDAAPSRQRRKRRRATTGSQENESDPLASAPVYKVGKRLPGRPPTPPSDPIPTLPDSFPPPLARLDRLFRCINAVHSFTASRRDSSSGAGGVRWSLLQASIEKLLPWKPSLRDLALVSLVAGADLLSFCMMPESALEDGLMVKGGPADGLPLDRDDPEVVVVFIEATNTSRRSGSKRSAARRKIAMKKAQAAAAGVMDQDATEPNSSADIGGSGNNLLSNVGPDEEGTPSDSDSQPSPPSPPSAPDPPWSAGFGGRSVAVKSKGAAVLAAEHASRLRKEVDRRDRHFRSRIEELAEKLEGEGLDPEEYLDRIFSEENAKRRIGGQSLTSPPRKRVPIGDPQVFGPEEPFPPERPPELLLLIPELQSEDWWKDQIVPGGLMTSDARPARFADLSYPLTDSVKIAFKDAQNVERFYLHQARGIDGLLKDERDVVVVTSTASGKSVVYQVPILLGLEKNPDFRALLIFPTKALAQDQLRSLRQLIFAHPVLQAELEQNPWMVQTYDGDTPEEDRKRIRANTKVVLTNPDMIHVAMLNGPACARGSNGWDGFFAHTQLIVLDELHVYSSAFGSHACNVFRRLKRLLDLMGNHSVRVIGCSATIAEPGSHLQTLVGLRKPPLTIDEDGSPRGPRHHIVWNPPFIDPLNPSKGRRSVVTEASSMVRFLIRRGVRTVVFCKYRKLLELLLRQIHQDMEYEGRAALKSKVVGYRAGYVAGDRRKIERALFSGDILGVVATTALELGVDIGSLDAVIHLSFPFSLASYRQQAGRAGRRRQDALSILLCDTIDPVSQYYANHPGELIDGTPTPLPIDPLHASVIEGHLNCAAFEVPIDVERDWVYFSPEQEEDDLEEAEAFALSGGEDPLRMPIITLQGAKQTQDDPKSFSHMSLTGDESSATNVQWRKSWLRQRLERWLEKDNNGLYQPHRRFLPRPALFVQLRDADEDSYSVINDATGKIMEEIQHSRAIFDLYEGSVFIHQGRTFLVHKLNVDKQIAYLRPTNVTYVTEQRDYTDVDALRTRMRTQVGGADQDAWGFYGDVRITSKVFGYYKVDPTTRKVLETVDSMDMPPFIKHSVGLWIDVPNTTQMILRSMQIPIDFAVHAAAHALMLVLPRRVNTGSGADVRTECKYPFQTRIRPARVTLYDQHSNGAGVTLRAFRDLTELLKSAWQTVETCSCMEQDGCVQCVKLASCKEHNLALNKEGARQIFRGLLGVTS